MKEWKTLKRRRVLEPNRFLAVDLHTVELPNGRIIDDWPWVELPEYSVILARTVEGEFLCFRQVKYAIPGVTLAPPGGYLEPGEDPLAAARRELREETGYEAPTWRPLGSYVVDSNRGAGKAHLFLALDARPAGRKTADDLEEQSLLLLSRVELERALDTGEIRIVAWAALVALALRAIDKDVGRKRDSRAKRRGGIILWIFILLAVGVGAYLAFGVMRLHEIRSKIDEAMGKKPVSATKGDEGALMIHQERLRQESELQEKLQNEATEAQGKVDARNKQLRREFMRAERGEDPPRSDQ